LLDLAAQPGQFLSLGRTQAFLAGRRLPAITGGLIHPIHDGLRGDLELSGKLGWRPASANKLDYLLTEFGRIGRMCFGHRRLLKIKILSVHEKESTPTPNSLYETRGDSVSFSVTCNMAQRYFLEHLSVTFNVAQLGIEFEFDIRTYPFYL
jgi:hypothetical protein